MCGIAGAINWSDAHVVARMTNALRHRGPDDQGVMFFPEDRVGLGHCRLSIIDLSPAGHQPMRTEDEQLWITFNGEIYNFRDLRRTLEERGHRFRSATDTEVILHLFQEYGPDFVTRLNGMFAFAIFDKSARKILFARDHIGIKPLYYYYDHGRLLFASEIKGILQSGRFTPNVNWQAIHDYFTFSCVPCPDTAFEGIRQLPPAHTMTFDLRSNELTFGRYWDLGQAVDEASSLGDSRARLKELLADSVRHQMLSDVPLGVLLSGGVDSPILVGLAAQVSSRPVKTFTIGFEGRHLGCFDERNAARAVARQFRTDHHEISVSVKDPVDMLHLVSCFDQPFGNPTAYLMYLISKHTRSEVKVALCGTGGDELFAGYPRYRAIGLGRLFRHLPAPAVSAAKMVLGLFSDHNRNPTLRRAREFLNGLDSNFTQQFMNWTYYLDEDEKSQLLQPPTAAFKPSSRVLGEYLEANGIEDFGNRVLAADVRTFLLDNLLEYTDKMSMSVALELRVPYLDPRVVAQALAIPFSRKLGHRRGKLVLRELFPELLTPAIRYASKKGFVPPLGIWMRECLDGYFDRHMTREDTEREGIFSWDAIQALRYHHTVGAADYSYDLSA